MATTGTSLRTLSTLTSTTEETRSNPRIEVRSTNLVVRCRPKVCMGLLVRAPKFEPSPGVVLCVCGYAGAVNRN